MYVKGKREREKPRSDMKRAGVSVESTGIQLSESGGLRWSTLNTWERK